MNNNTEVKVPVTPELWRTFSTSLQDNTKKLTSTMAYYRSDQVRFNMEDLGPMRQQCEEILQSCNHIYEDVLAMIQQAREIDDLGYKNEEWWIRQGEYELQANKL